MGYRNLCCKLGLTGVSEGVSLKYQNKLLMVGNSFELRNHTPEPQGYQFCVAHQIPGSSPF